MNLDAELNSASAPWSEEERFSFGFLDINFQHVNASLNTAYAYDEKHFKTCIDKLILKLSTKID